MEQLKLQDSIKTPNLAITPGEGRGGSFVEVCTTATPAQIQALVSLQAELDPRGYRLDPTETRVWSYPGDVDARRKARGLIPEILSAAASSITQALPAVITSRSRPDRLAYNIPGTNINGYLRITEITPAKEWTLDALGGDDPQFHLPHLGLMVLARCRPSTSDAPEKYLDPQRSAIRMAIEKAVEPLLKLEPSPIIHPDPLWARP
jgi:hypothetical protein